VFTKALVLHDMSMSAKYSSGGRITDQVKQSILSVTKVIL